MKTASTFKNVVECTFILGAINVFLKALLGALRVGAKPLLKIVHEPPFRATTQCVCKMKEVGCEIMVIIMSPKGYEMSSMESKSNSTCSTYLDNYHQKMTESSLPLTFSTCSSMVTSRWTYIGIVGV